MIDPPSDLPGSHLKFFSSDLAWTWWKMIDLPPGLTSGGNVGNSTFACTLQWCMQICHKPFPPSAESHLKMLIYYIFLLKMHIWNGCNALNIAGNPIKDINAKLTFLSSYWQINWQIYPQKSKFQIPTDRFIFWKLRQTRWPIFPAPHTRSQIDPHELFYAKDLLPVRVIISFLWQDHLTPFRTALIQIRHQGKKYSLLDLIQLNMHSIWPLYKFPFLECYIESIPNENSKSNQLLEICLDNPLDILLIYNVHNTKGQKGESSS